MVTRTFLSTTSVVQTFFSRPLLRTLTRLLCLTSWQKYLGPTLDGEVAGAVAAEAELVVVAGFAAVVVVLKAV
jgi:hypothetical protein